MQTVDTEIKPQNHEYPSPGAAGKYLDLVFNFEQKQSSRLFADWVNVCIQDKKVTKYLVAAYVNSKYIHY